MGKPSPSVLFFPLLNFCFWSLVIATFYESYSDYGMKGVLKQLKSRETQGWLILLYIACIALIVGICLGDIPVPAKNYFCN